MQIEPNYQKWSETITRTQKLWDIATGGTKKAYTNVCKEYGLLDNINDVFVTQWKTRNKEKINYITKLKSENAGKIFNPFLRLKGAVIFSIIKMGLDSK